MSETPVRRIRIDNDTWEKITEHARLNGETASSLIRRAVIQYVKEHQ